MANQRRPQPTQAELAERRRRVRVMTSEGMSIDEIGEELDVTRKTVLRDLAYLREHPVERERVSLVGYIDSPIVRSILAAAQRTTTEDWVKAVATLAETAATNKDERWFREMRDASETLWCVYSRITNLLRDSDYRNMVITSPEQRDSAYPNTPERRAKLGLRVAN